MDQPKPNITLIVFYASSYKKEEIMLQRQPMLDRLNQRFDITLQYVDELTAVSTKDPNTIYLPFIASGGCEELFQRMGFMVPRPFYLFYDGLFNSMPAALEIASYVAIRSQDESIICCEEELTIPFINQLAHFQQLARKLRVSRIGVIGEPSPWLIASNVDTVSITRSFGMQFEQIPLYTIYDLFRKNTKLKAPIQEEYDEFLAHLSHRHEIDYQALTDAFLMYQSIFELIEYSGLTAITIRCFELIEKCHASACLALSLLNNKGFAAGCEGDIPSLITMITASSLTNQPAFMANPVFYHSQMHILELAHCSAPTVMTSSYGINTHFETNSCVGIEATFEKETAYTLVKWCGEHLDNFYCIEGVSSPMPYVENRCRTQLAIRFPLTAPAYKPSGIANHIIALRGYHKDILASWNNYATSLLCK